MEVVAHFGQALVGVGHEHSRRIEGLARLNGIAEQAVIDAHDETGLVVLVELCFRQKAPRVHQSEAVAGAIILIGSTLDQRDERVLLVGRDAAAAADLMYMVGKGLALDLALLAVSAGKGDQVHAASVHVVHVDGHDALEVYAAISAVVDARSAHNDIGLFKDGVEERHCYFGDGVLDGELQGLHCVEVRREGGRKTVQGEGSVVNLVRDVAAVEGKTAVTVLYFYGVNAEVALLLGGEFLGLGVEGEGALPEGIVGVPREAAVVAADQITEIFIADRGSVIQMVYIVEIADLELIGGLCSMQGKGFLILIVNYGHDNLPS